MNWVQKQFFFNFVQRVLYNQKKEEDLCCKLSSSSANLIECSVFVCVRLISSVLHETWLSPKVAFGANSPVLAYLCWVQIRAERIQTARPARIKQLRLKAGHKVGAELSASRIEWNLNVVCVCVCVCVYMQYYIGFTVRSIRHQLSY